MKLFLEFLKKLYIGVTHYQIHDRSTPEKESEATTYALDMMGVSAFERTGEIVGAIKGVTANLDTLSTMIWVVSAWLEYESQDPTCRRAKLIAAGGRDF